MSDFCIILMDGERLQCVVTPEAIKHKGTLQCLSSNVSLGNAGCIALAKAMQYTNTLQTLTIDVENKEMEVAGCIALAKAVKQNGTLQPLTINHDDTEIGQDRIAALSASIDAVVLRNREIEFQRRTLLQLAKFSLDNGFRSLKEHVFRTHIFIVFLPHNCTFRLLSRFPTLP